MSDFYPGDRVICVADWKESYTKEGVVKKEWCEYGDHVLGVDFDDGTYAEIGYDGLEHVEDPYEYAVEWAVKGSDVSAPVKGDCWVQRGSAERMIEFNERMFPDKMQKYTVRLVKRRKAGPVLDASDESG